MGAPVSASLLHFGVDSEDDRGDPENGGEPTLRLPREDGPLLIGDFIPFRAIMHVPHRCLHVGRQDTRVSLLSRRGPSAVEVRVGRPDARSGVPGLRSGSESTGGGGDDSLAEETVGRATDHCTDSEWNNLAEDDDALLRAVLVTKW